MFKNWKAFKFKAEVKFHKFLEWEKECGSPVTIIIMFVTVLFVLYILSLF